MKWHLLLRLSFPVLFCASLAFADEQPTCKKLSLRGARDVVTDETGKVAGAAILLCNDQCDKQAALLAPAVGMLVDKDTEASIGALASLTPATPFLPDWPSKGLPAGACAGYTLKVDPVWIP